jgi:hypothetical protein
MLRVLQDMYSRVTRAVLINDAKTGYVDIEAGVPQGAVLSPFLYSVYVNGLHKALRDKGYGVMVYGRQVPLLMYADDIVLLARSPREMGLMHRVLDDYARKWRFTVNNRKSDIVVVGTSAQRAFVRALYWSLGGREIEVVKEYKYLGLEMGKMGPGRWNSALRRFVDKATKRSNLIAFVARGKNGLRPASAIQVWFSMGRPLLEYGCEIWGGEMSKAWIDKFEGVQNKFMAATLGAGNGAPCCGLRRELGVPSLRIRRQILKIKFWIRLRATDGNRLLRMIYERRKGEVEGGGGSLSWCRGMKDLLGRWGLADEWYKQSGEASSHLAADVEDLARVRELHQRDCDVHAKPSLRMYAKLPLQPEGRIQPYLHDRYNISGTWLKLKLRLNTIMLMGRMASMLRWPKAGGVCPMCPSGVTEDVPHFLLDCAAYACERTEFFAALRRRIGEGAYGTFANADRDTQLGMLLGPCYEIGPTDPSEQAKFLYALDKTAKNYFNVCWRKRRCKMGRYTLRQQHGRTRLHSDDTWQPPEEMMARAVTKMSRTELEASDVADALVGDGGWKEWCVRKENMWRKVPNCRRRRYFVVTQGWHTGLFYKWSDCWRAIRGYHGWRFKGFMSLNEARSHAMMAGTMSDGA